jgi:hypothetical protein
MRRGTLVGATLAVLAVLAPPAFADQSAPTWNCRASALQLFGSTPEPRFEPLVANGDGTTGADRPACAADREGAPELAAPDGAPFTGHIQAPYSVTSLTPALGAARDQAAYAGTKAADVALASPDGSLTFTATAVRAEAVASCVSGVPKLDGSSTVLDLRVNGVPLPIDDSVLSQITTQFDDSPFGGVIKVLVNQKIPTADGLTVQAVRIELFDAAGAPQGVAVLGEAKVAKQGDTCAAAAPPAGNGGGSGTNGTNGTNGSTGATGSNGANGANGTNTTNPGTGGSGTTVVKKVVINGRHGGCGRVHAWFEKVDLLHRLPGKPNHATSRFGQRVMIRGQLLSCKGTPIVGARLDQFHVVGKGVGRLLKTGIKTRAGGRFTYIEPLNLTTRKIILSYRGNVASKKVTSRRVLRLTVRGKRGQIIRGRPPRTLE